MSTVMRWSLAAALVSLVAAPGAAGAPPHAPGSVIVKYVDGASRSQRSLADRRAGVKRRIGRIAGVRAELVRVAGDPVAAAARLERSRAVRYAEPNYLYAAATIPNDPRFSTQWGLHNTGQAGGRVDADIDAPEGWDAAGIGSFPPARSGAKIGIVDTGISFGHPDLVGATVNCAGVRHPRTDPTIVNGGCSDDNGHGTHVAGIAAARTNNAVGVAGVAFKSPLAICKALGADGIGTMAGVANCIVRLAQNGAKVISMSIGGPHGNALADAVAVASRHALLIAAAGNTADPTPNYPAAYSRVVSVAATNRCDRWAPFSTYNRDVEISAPGVGILSTWPGNSYVINAGTSMATPHVAGVAAIVAGRNPGGGPNAWRLTLRAAVDDVETPGYDVWTGFGRINLAKAVGGAAVYGGTPCAPPPACAIPPGDPGGSAGDWGGPPGALPPGNWPAGSDPPPIAEGPDDEDYPINYPIPYPGQYGETCLSPDVRRRGPAPAVTARRTQNLRVYLRSQRLRRVDSRGRLALGWASCGLSATRCRSARARVRVIGAATTYATGLVRAKPGQRKVLRVTLTRSALRALRRARAPRAARVVVRNGTARALRRTLTLRLR